MSTLIRKSLLYGLLIGIVFFFIAPLGLSFSFAEFLKPVLTPGTYITRIFLQANDNIVEGSIMHWVLAVVLNVLIYAAVSFVVLRFKNRKSN